MSSLVEYNVENLQALIVDGLGTIRHEIETLLKEHGIANCHQASNVLDANALFDEFTPEIVILNQDFIEVTKKIKSADETVARIIYSDKVVIKNKENQSVLHPKFKDEFVRYLEKSFYDAKLRANNLSGVNKENKKYRVLIVDDDSLVQLMIQDGLINAGYDVVAIVNNEERAFEEYISKKPDIVLLDMFMEHEDSGLRILERISEHENQKIPSAVVMMTSQAESHLIMKAFNLGADEYILKSSSEGRVLTGIKRAIQKKHL